MKTRLLLLIILLALPALAFCQDRILKNDGETITAKVVAVNPQTIIYKAIDNPDGPEYTINRSEVKQIRYKNGKVEKFAEANMGMDHTRKNSGRYKKSSSKNDKTNNNIVCIVPTAFPYDQTIYNDIAVGASYERLFGRNKMFGFTITGLINFYAPYDPNNNTTTGATTTANPALNHTSYYLIPGIKFYPGGAKAKFRYSVGVCAFVAKGNETDKSYYIDQNGVTQEMIKKINFTAAGMLLSNSLNLSPGNHLYMGLQFDMGCPFADNRVNGGTGVNSPMIMLAFRGGYRF